MTVSYSDKSFLRLLFRWRGSVWKLILVHYLIFLLLYFALNLSYRLLMDTDQQREFEKVVLYFDKWNRLIPLQFLIGFYVSTIFVRWWEQLNHVAWPDKFLIFVTGIMQGMDEETRLIRRTFARYCNLISVLVWKEICLKIKKRFPTEDHLLKAGLITESELELFHSTASTHGTWFIPVSWMINLLAKCKKDGRITDVEHMKLLEELYAYRGNSAMLTLYDWINIPLVYTQVVTLATYGYFAFCLISRQSLMSGSPFTPEIHIELIFPLFTSLEFVFYIGWMKVGEALRYVH